MLNPQGSRVGGRLGFVGISRIVLDAPFLAGPKDLQMQPGRKPAAPPVGHGRAANTEHFGDDLVAAQCVDDLWGRKHGPIYSSCLKFVKPDEPEMIIATGLGTMRAMKSASTDRTIDAIAARLRQTRGALGYNQITYAVGAGIAPNTYNQWEKAKGRPGLEEAQKLCDQYGLTLDWIYRGDPSGLPQRVFAALFGQTG